MAVAVVIVWVVLSALEAIVWWKAGRFTLRRLRRTRPAVAQAEGCPEYCTCRAHCVWEPKR